MKRLFILIISLIVVCSLYAQTTYKTCKKCSGYGFIHEYELCPTCNGKQRILCCHNSYGQPHIHTTKCYMKCNICTALGVGIKTGYIKKKIECDKCCGKGKLISENPNKKQVIKIKKSSVQKLMDEGILENDKLKIILMDDN